MIQSMFTKDTHCRICGSNWYDDTNNEGWWCANCDGYNYWNLAAHDNHKFIVILEDKLQKEATVRRKSIYKKQLSPLRYPGGKSKLIDYLATFIRKEKAKTLISPFLGGGSVELALLEAGTVQKLLINDLDYGLYSLWWTMLHMPDDLITRIEEFNPTQKAFYDAQSLIKSDYLHLNNLDAAWITLLVNRLAYSGIAKANSMGGKQGSVHDLTVRWNPKTLIKRIREIHKLADRIEVFCEDAVEFIEAYFWDDSATLFIDPPYFVKGKDLYNIHPTKGLVTLYKRHYYIEQLQKEGVSTINGKPLHLAEERDLLYMLTKCKVRSS